MKIRLIILYILIPIVLCCCTFRGSHSYYKNDIIDGHVSTSPDDQKIIFSYYIDNIASIYIADISGKNVKRLTSPENESHVFPEFSPDGKKISFISYPIEAAKDTPYSFIYIMDIDSLNKRQLTFKEKEITEAVFSKDGSKLYFLNSGYFGHSSPIVGSHPHDFDIFSIDISGANLMRITNKEAYEMNGLSNVMDGKYLLCKIGEYKNSRFSYISLDSLNKEIHIKSFEGAYYNPQLSPNGKYLAFTLPANHGGTYQYELFIEDMETKEIKQLTFLKKHVTSPRFFNNQEKMILMDNFNWPERPYNHRITIINTDGSELQHIKIDIPNRK